jgi:hypothetical protein
MVMTKNPPATKTDLGEVKSLEQHINATCVENSLLDPTHCASTYELMLTSGPSSALSAVNSSLAPRTDCATKLCTRVTNLSCARAI